MKDNQSVGIASNFTQTTGVSSIKNSNLISYGVRLKFKKLVSFKDVNAKKCNNLPDFNKDNNNKLYYRSSSFKPDHNGTKSILRLRKLTSKTTTSSVTPSYTTMSKGLISKKNLKVKKVIFKEGDKLAEIKKVKSISHYYNKEYVNKKGKDEKIKINCSCACTIY